MEQAMEECLRRLDVVENRCQYLEKWKAKVETRLWAHWKESSSSAPTSTTDGVRSSHDHNRANNAYEDRESECGIQIPKVTSEKKGFKVDGIKADGNIKIKVEVDAATDNTETVGKNRPTGILKKKKQGSISSDSDFEYENPGPSKKHIPKQMPKVTTSPLHLVKTSPITTTTPTGDSRNFQDTSDENPDKTPCGVCMGIDPEESNNMVFCSTCELCVHQACYGVRPIPLGDWKCAPCSKGLIPGQLSCHFCPKMGDKFSSALKPVQSLGGDVWAHVSCATWIPEVKFLNELKMEPISIYNETELNKRKKDLKCYICKNPDGVCIQCYDRKCTTAFHVTCAFEKGLTMQRVHTITPEDYFEQCVYCKKHGKKTPRPSTKRSNSAKGLGPSPKKKA